ncbi:MAG: DUF4126 domain-containing protein [Arcicella sp.]|nr:DUF4126 domain-containing protein [Arcicella sp.]
MLELLSSLALGIGLSACCGFRVFVPMLVTNLASLAGHYHFGNGLEWMGTMTAFYIFASATILEILGYYIPWFDNLLDSIATPASIIAGTILTTAFISGDLSPTLKWILGFLVGGGSAGVVQLGTTATRLASTATTAGFGNPIIATIEIVLSIIFSILSVFLPILIGVGAILLVMFLGKKLVRRL